MQESVARTGRQCCERITLPRVQNVTTDLLKSTAQVPASNNGVFLAGPQISSAVQEVLSSISFVDIHTHLFAPAFGNIGLWGIDELLTHHFLEAEIFLYSDMVPPNYCATT